MAVQGLLDRMKGVRVIERKVPIEIEPTRILMADQRSPVLFTDLNGMKAAGNLWSERERITAALGHSQGRI